MNDDTISRAAAIEALKEEEYPCETDYDEGFMAGLDKAVWIVEKWLPSAQLIDVQEAYYRGKIDGIEECMTRMKKVDEEFANG